MRTFTRPVPRAVLAEYDHVPGLREQLKREPRKLSGLAIAKKPFDQLQFEDFQLLDYNPQPKIKFKVAV